MAQRTRGDRRPLRPLLWLALAAAAVLCFCAPGAAGLDRDNSREALIKLDSGSEKGADGFDAGVSEQTKREVERQRQQRESRKKRQAENRAKRQKRLEEMNSRIRRKELKKKLAGSFWIVCLVLVMVCGCVFAFNDVTILCVSYFGKYFGMDVEAFVKARRKIARSTFGSAGVWADAVFSFSKKLLAQGRPVSATLSSGNLAASLDNSGGGGGGGGGVGGSPGLGSWFSASKFKNSEDQGDEEAGYRQGRRGGSGR